MKMDSLPKEYINKVAKAELSLNLVTFLIIPENEFFEIYSGRTIIPIRLSGEGITPKYDISPEFLVYRFDYKKGPGKYRDECVIEIHNKCAAPLPFTLVEETLAFKEEIVIPPTVPPEVDETDGKKDKKKKSMEKSKKGAKKSRSGSRGRSRTGSRGRSRAGSKGRSRSGRKTKRSLGKVLKQIDSELNPEEAAILTENISDTTESPFRAIIESGGSEFVVLPTQKFSFIVKFSSPELNVEESSMEKDISPRKSSAKGKKRKKTLSSKGKDKRKSSAKSKKKSKVRGDATPGFSDQTGKTSMDPEGNQIQKRIQYAAKYNLILGKTMNVKDFFFAVSSDAKIQSESKTKK